MLRIILASGIIAVSTMSNCLAADKNKPNIDVVKLEGQVVDEAGKPIPNAQVTLESYRDPDPTTTSNAEGRFELTVPDDTWKWRALSAELDGGKRLGTFQISGESAVADLKNLKIPVAAAREVIIRVVNAAGKPIDEASVGVIAGYRHVGTHITDKDGSATVFVPKNAEIQQVYAKKDDVGFDYKSYELPRRLRNDQKAVKPQFPAAGVTLTLDGVQPLSVTMLTGSGAPIPGITVYPWLLTKRGEPGEINLSFISQLTRSVKTDVNGIAVIRWIPKWQQTPLTIWPNSKEHIHKRGNYDPTTGKGQLEMRLERLVAMRGSVVLPDGSPASGITIDVAGAGFGHDDFRRTIKSRDDGTFEVLANPDQVYLLVVKDRKWGAEPLTGFALWPGKPIENLRFQLRSATRIHGVVTIGPDKKPVPGLQIFSYQSGADAHNMKEVVLPNPENSRRWVCPTVVHSVSTDKDGKYEYFVGPGTFDIRGPNQNKIEKFEIRDEREKTFSFHMPRPERGTLKGLVVFGTPPRPMVGAKVVGIYHHELGAQDLEAVTDVAGRFELQRQLHPTAMHVESADRTLGALLEIDADATEITIPLQRLAAVTGTLVDDVTGAPYGNREVTYNIPVHLGDKNSPFRTAWGGLVITNPDGKFVLQRLVPGNEYRINLTLPGGQSWRQVGTITPSKPGVTQLGEMRVKNQQ